MRKQASSTEARLLSHTTPVSQLRTLLAFVPTCCSSISLRASTMGGSRMDAGVTRRRAAYAVAKPSSADATCDEKGMGGTAMGWKFKASCYGLDTKPAVFTGMG